jgi:DNA-directed RNA polymerase subunit RPC12/RpoP
MPIQFRCGACQQLLGIAKRKAGSVVDCPTCRTKTIVPATAPDTSEPPPPPIPPIRQKPHSIFDKVDVDRLLQKPMKPELVEENDSAVAIAPPPVRRKMVFTTNLMEDPLINDPLNDPPNDPLEEKLPVKEVKKDTVLEDEPKAMQRLGTGDVEPVDDEPFALSPVPVLTPERPHTSLMWLSLALTTAAIAIAGAFFLGHWVGATRPLF